MSKFVSNVKSIGCASLYFSESKSRMLFELILVIFFNCLHVYALIKDTQTH